MRLVTFLGAVGTTRFAFASPIEAELEPRAALLTTGTGSLLSENLNQLLLTNNLADPVDLGVLDTLTAAAPGTITGQSLGQLLGLLKGIFTANDVAISKATQIIGGINVDYTPSQILLSTGTCANLAIRFFGIQMIDLTKFATASSQFFALLPIDGENLDSDLLEQCVLTSLEPAITTSTEQIVALTNGLRAVQFPAPSAVGDLLDGVLDTVMGLLTALISIIHNLDLIINQIQMQIVSSSCEGAPEIADQMIDLRLDGLAPLLSELINILKIYGKDGRLVTANDFLELLSGPKLNSILQKLSLCSVELGNPGDLNILQGTEATSGVTEIVQNVAPVLSNVVPL